MIRWKGIPEARQSSAAAGRRQANNTEFEMENMKWRGPFVQPLSALMAFSHAEGKSAASSTPVQKGKKALEMVVQPCLNLMEKPPSENNLSCPFSPPVYLAVSVGRKK